MSLFEKLNNKRYNLQEGIDSKGNVTPDPDEIAQTKSVLRNIKKRQNRTISQNKAAGEQLKKDIAKRLSASTTRGDQARSQYSIGDGSSIGTPEGATATKTKTVGVKQAEVSKKAKEFTKKINKKRTGGFENVTGEGQVKYPKTRKDLIAKRKEYGIDSKGNISNAGVKRYAQKTKQLSSGSNIPAKITAKDLKVAKLRAVGGAQIKNKAGKVIGTTTGKYGGKLTTPSKKPLSLAKVQAKIDAKNPTYKSPITGGKLPVKQVRNPDLKRMSPADRATYREIKRTTPKGGIPKWMKDFDKQYPDKSKLGNINDPMPKTILKKQKYFKGQEIPGFRKVSTATKAGKKFYQQQVETGRRLKPNQLTGEPIKPLTRFQKIKKAVTTGWKIPKDTGNFIEITRGTGKNITKTLTRKSYKPNLVGTIAKNLDKVPNRYKLLAAAGLIGYGLIGRNKTAKADANAGAGAVPPKKKIMKYTTGTTTLKLGGKTNPNPIKGLPPGYDF